MKYILIAFMLLAGIKSNAQTDTVKDVTGYHITVVKCDTIRTGLFTIEKIENGKININFVNGYEVIKITTNTDSVRYGSLLIGGYGTLNGNLSTVKNDGWYVDKHTEKSTQYSQEPLQGIFLDENKKRITLPVYQAFKL